MLPGAVALIGDLGHDNARRRIDQQQAIGSYYSFPNVTVDRYQSGGKARITTR